MAIKDLDIFPKREMVDGDELAGLDACSSMVSTFAEEISDVHCENNDEITDKQKFIVQSRLRTILAIAHAGCFDGLWTPLSEDKFALYEEKETEEPMEPVR
jgi:hypothetical protein